jgi:hypothetical protein
MNEHVELWRLTALAAAGHLYALDTTVKLANRLRLVEHLNARTDFAFEALLTGALRLCVNLQVDDYGQAHCVEGE